MDERCELCALPLASDHPHLFERPRRMIVCACESCATLFGVIDSQRYARIRPLVRRLAGPAVDDAAWSALGVPVGLAFLSRATSGEVVAAYPGPAGAMSASVSAEAWHAVAARYPMLEALQPDVEAWLVNRLPAQSLHYHVSIDHCYRLAGLVRSRWRGLGGGPDVAQAIAEFFRALEEQAAA